MAEIENARRNDTRFLLFDLFKSTSGNVETNRERRSSARGFKGSVRNFSK